MFVLCRGEEKGKIKLNRIKKKKKICLKTKKKIK